MEYDRIVSSPSMEITRDELTDVAYMCYVLNQSEMTRWYHRWRTCLERMANEGWTWDGLHYRGMFVQMLERIYGLSPRQSRMAVKKYPLVNMGIEPWEVLTERSANELANKIYRSYVGLPEKRGCDFCSSPDHDSNGEEPDCSYNETCETESVCEDEESADMGGCYFL